MAASRDWICVRLATYESAEEAELLKGIFIGRSGELENTTFALLASDGKTRLSRAGRGPAWVIGERGGPHHRASSEATHRFANRLEQVARKTRPRATIEALPLGLDLRRSLNVAACDEQLLVVVRSAAKARREEAVDRLASLCWSEAHVGRFQYAAVEEVSEMTTIEEVPQEDAVIVVAPGAYGLEGRVVARAKIDASLESLDRLLVAASAAFDPAPRDKPAHLHRGRRTGRRWETEIPVTDPGPAGHRGRGRRQRRPRSGNGSPKLPGRRRAGPGPVGRAAARAGHGQGV